MSFLVVNTNTPSDPALSTSEQLSAVQVRAREQLGMIRDGSE